MASNTEKTVNTQIMSQSGLEKFVKIIGKLAGDEPNLKISFRELKFNIGKTEVSLKGEVDFNVIRKEAAK